ncbi:hypothetical protein IDJ77_03915 [Mucilaginibacter sp. ZT4R22]|uniref:Uncharacterized protein n=1 Tax=Mucilaginibacter pankratovii TaxID=2772110 RepID=A0ABR7WN74_9SPHI|nr:hypothetical protein [Mucilaginibacter pankratovii]MBD1362947.1 hypothetical protein [Mucilaginibacter pankratovii]
MYYAGKFYEVFKKDLCDWVWNNKKLLRKITPHNLKYLFEFHANRGLSIDLRRFEPEYYLEVFYPPEIKKASIDEFVRKACVVIAQNLQRDGRTDLTLTITVRHMVSEQSHWKTFLIDENFNGKLLWPLTKNRKIGITTSTIYLSLMTLNDFNALNKDESAAAAIHGKFVDIRYEDNFKVALYSHPEFYVEVFYEGKNNQIVRCRAFTSATQLAAYIHLT